MKNAHQWMAEFYPTGLGIEEAKAFAERCRLIQQDAIRHAAEYASRITTCGGGSHKIAGMLRAEAFRVGAGQPLRQLPPEGKKV